MTLSESTQQVCSNPPGSELLQVVPDPAFVIDALNLCVVAANEQAVQLTGFLQQELAGKKFSDLVRLEQDSVENALSEAARNGLHPYSGSIRCKDGSEIPVEVATPRFEREGRAYILSSAKKVEAGPEPFLPGEVEFREFAQDANDIIYSHDLRGRMTWTNRSTRRLFGYEPEEAIGMSVAQLVDPSYLPIVQKNIRDKVEDGKETPPYEILCRSKSGEEVWLEVSTRVVKRNGKPAFILGIGRDITERKHTEAALRESSRKLLEQRVILERMIEQNPYAIAFWNPDGTCQLVNPAFKTLLGGVPPSNYCIFTDPLVEKMGAMEYMRRAFAGEKILLEKFTYEIQRSVGNETLTAPIHMSVTLFPLSDPDGKLLFVVSIYQDLNRQIEAESSREKLEAQLLQAQKMEAIGTLAGGVAHDFNNLLTGILGYLDMLRTVIDKKGHPYIDKAELAAQRGTDLTRQLLAYARKTRLEVQPHDLNKTVEEVATLIRQTVDRRIEIEMKTSDEPATISADPGRMSQVLMNLCINARDAIMEKLVSDEGKNTRDWRPKILIEVCVQNITSEYCQNHTYARPGDHVRLSVIDNGIGMDESTRRRIFDPFFTTKPVGAGTGLGLSTIFGIIKQHQGWIEVYSEPGKGSVFHVYLMAVHSKPVPLSTAATNLRARGGKETILLVDDEEMIRDLGADILQSHGYRVRVAADGYEAMEIFSRESGNIDLVILDLTMPRLSGREILPKLLERKPSIKVIISSGYSSDEDSDSLLSRGAAAFVQKPYTTIELAQVVRRVLDC